MNLPEPSKDVSVLPRLRWSRRRLVEDEDNVATILEHDPRLRDLKVSPLSLDAVDLSVWIWRAYDLVAGDRMVRLALLRRVKSSEPELVRPLWAAASRRLPCRMADLLNDTVFAGARPAMTPENILRIGEILDALGCQVENGVWRVREGAP